MYMIVYADGARRSRSCETYEHAIAACAAEWPSAVIGHDGDLTDGGSRSLVWASEADSVNDDGARAVAVIRRA